MRFKRRIKVPSLGLSFATLLILAQSSPGEFQHFLASQAPATSVSFSPPSVVAVPFLLASVYRRDQAWAAYLIGQHGLRGYVPQLTRLLAATDPLATPSTEQTETRALNRAILDTFIQLKAQVAGDRLMPLYNDFGDEVLIALSFSPKGNRETLLSLADRPLSDTRWFLVCNLLAASRAEGFAAKLLRDLTIKVSLFVSESGLTGVAAGEGNSGGIGCGSFGMPKDFPPTSIYELSEEAQDGDVLLAPGFRSIYYRRHLVPMNRQIGVGHGSTLSDRDTFRKEYLAGLLGRDSRSLRLNPRPYHPIRWTNAEGLVAQAKRIRELHTRFFWQLVRELGEEGLLSSEETEALRPNLGQNHAASLTRALACS